ncbi:hypothetical protein P3T26_003801 [Streptomyces sp. MAA16]|nr:hypothetical protein [Streptomyces sp. MAA16]
MQQIINGTQFTDTDGNPVHAHGGGLVEADGFHYWFGEDRHPDNTFRSVLAYRSVDLVTWEFRGPVLTQESDPELRDANIERPKVIRNPVTGQFVLWMHKEAVGHYREARAAVAVSDTPDGPYTYRGSFRPLGHMSRDLTVHRDTDGTGYLISAANDNEDLHVYRLTDDYLGAAELVRVLWAGLSREAPAVFRRGGVYFLLTSGCSGWRPNQQQYATADAIDGEWSELRDFGDATTYASQTAYALAVPRTGGAGAGADSGDGAGVDHLYLGDRWAANWDEPVNASRYVWLPLTFPTPRTLSMAWSDKVAIDVTDGTARPL